MMYQCWTRVGPKVILFHVPPSPPQKKKNSALASYQTKTCSSYTENASVYVYIVYRYTLNTCIYIVNSHIM